jgi:hypothetical protein
VSRLTRIAIAVIVFAGAGFGYWKFDLQPKRAEAAKLEQELATQEAQLAQTQALIQTYEGARAAYKDNYATVVRLGKARGGRGSGRKRDGAAGLGPANRIAHDRRIMRQEENK